MRSYQSAQCNTDHSLVGCKINICVKKIHCNNTPIRCGKKVGSLRDYQKCTIVNDQDV